MRTLTHPDPSALEPCITKDVIKSSSRTQTARMMMMPVELAPHSFTTRCGDEFLFRLPQTDRGAAFPILLVSWSLYGKSLKKRQRQSKSRRFRQVLNADKTVRLTFGPHSPPFATVDSVEQANSSQNHSLCHHASSWKWKIRFSPAPTRSISRFANKYRSSPYRVPLLAGGLAAAPAVAHIKF